jgi:hypothetical protein
MEASKIPTHARPTLHAAAMEREWRTMASAAKSHYRELAYRANDGIEVVLFWHRASGELAVAVSDTRSGAYFELAAAPEEALAVFHHPYAYAAFRGLPYVEEPLASWAEASTHPEAQTA